MVISDSSISHNRNELGGYGGGIENYGTLEISNSTVSGNSAVFKGYGLGGGILNGGILIITNSTIAHNSADGHGGGINTEFGTLEIANTILKAGTQGANILSSPGMVTSRGYNLSSDNGGGFLIATGDQINTNPMLGPLQDNGGPTFTHNLLNGSPAIDAGDPSFVPPPSTDQRGYPRISNSRIDIGSLETTPILNGKIAFYRFVQLPKRSAYEIFSMDPDGSHQTRLTFSQSDGWVYNFDPRWSPDGERIAFAREVLIPPFFTPGAVSICLMDASGSNWHCLTDPSHGDGQPAWSPDATKIAFSRFEYPNFNGEIYVMNSADGSNQTNLTNNPASDYFPDWSPDGTKIAFASNRDGISGIYVMDTDGSHLTRLTKTSASEPRWSPDGTKIAFTTDRDGNNEIYVMDADGSNPVRLTNNSTGDNQPSWSPDGTKIAFTSGGISVMDADGSNPVSITADGREPDWQRLSALPTPTPSPCPFCWQPSQ